MKQKIIQIKTDVDDMLLGIDTAIPCGLIINELVTNSLKHGFPGDKEGLITVQLRKTNEKFILRVIDDGVGFPETIDYQNTETLGLQLINSLVMQLDGTMDFITDNGTEFKIIFPEMMYPDRI